jgi:hypothetical protein
MVARHRRGFRIPRSPCRSPDDGETCGCAARQLDTHAVGEWYQLSMLAWFRSQAGLILGNAMQPGRILDSR